LPDIPARKSRKYSLLFPRGETFGALQQQEMMYGGTGAAICGSGSGIDPLQNDPPDSDIHNDEPQQIDKPPQERSVARP